MPECTFLRLNYNYVDYFIRIPLMIDKNRSVKSHELKGRIVQDFRVVVAMAYRMGAYSDASLSLMVGLKKFRISFTDWYCPPKKDSCTFGGQPSVYIHV
jgi:hypothetical protein